MTQMNQLEAWLAQEREVKARIDAGVGVGVARMEQVAGKTGLEVMQTMLRGELPFPPIAQTLDFMLVEVAEGRAYTTAELGINLVKAINGKAPRVRAEGKVIHCGRQLATAEARLYGPDGTLYAHGTTTCLVFEAPKAA